MATLRTVESGESEGMAESPAELFLRPNHRVADAQGQLSPNAGESAHEMTSKHGNPRRSSQENPANKKLM
jgi:hypothetical protein